MSIGVFVVVWSLGLVWFFERIPKQATPLYTDPIDYTDAIIVLTGGRKRIQTGLELLSFGYAKCLFVSGVHQHVTRNELLQLSQWDKPVMCCGECSDTCCIEIGYMATNTAENALETALWIEKKKYQSLRLVTSYYHIPRSLFEFQQVMSPSVKIIAHIVVVRDESVNWWDTVWLVTSEYHKFILTVLYHSLSNMISL